MGENDERQLKSVQFRYSFPSDEASSFAKKFAHAEYKRDPWESMPLPTGYAAYGTTASSSPAIKLAIIEQTHLSDKDSALLTLWVFSTWFHDVLSIAPGLIITGSAHEGDACSARTVPFLLPSCPRGRDVRRCSERNQMGYETDFAHFRTEPEQAFGCAPLQFYPPRLRGAEGLYPELQGPLSITTVRKPFMQARIRRSERCCSIAFTSMHLQHPAPIRSMWRVCRKK